MTYNVYLQLDNGETSFLAITHDQAQKIAEAFKKGKTTFSHNFQQYGFKKIYRIAIFENREGLSREKLNSWTTNHKFSLDPQMDVSTMVTFGDEVTASFIEDKEFGYEKTHEFSHATPIVNDFYVSPERIAEIRVLKSTTFDLAKLVKLLEEINDNWARGNYYSVGLIGRSLINHIPPLFGAFTSFDQVVANGPNTSFRKNAKSLNESLRAIADSYTHHLVRKKESLPNKQQTDFRADLDVILVEIIRLLH